MGRWKAGSGLGFFLGIAAPFLLQQRGMMTRSSLHPLDLRSAFSAAAAVLLGAALASTVQAQNLSADVPVNVTCFEQSGDTTVLDEEERERLCLGAESAAPAACFVAAKAETLLDDDVAIALCRCAQSVAPVRCYAQADAGGPGLDDDQQVASCRPVAVRDLVPATCRPRVR